MERTNGIVRSETWNKIYEIVKTIPREKLTCDAPDAPSVTTSIEELFLKLLPIYIVSSRRELLLAYESYNSLKITGKENDRMTEQLVNDYLVNNSG